MEAYLRYLKLIIDQKNLDFLVPHTTERKMMDFILLYYHFNEIEPIVEDILANNNFGSRATIHKKLKCLERSGYLKLSQRADKREKSVALTPKSKKYFNDLSTLIKKAVIPPG